MGDKCIFIIISLHLADYFSVHLFLQYVFVRKKKKDLSSHSSYLIKVMSQSNMYTDPLLERETLLFL